MAVYTRKTKVKNNNELNNIDTNIPEQINSGQFESTFKYPHYFATYDRTLI